VIVLYLPTSIIYGILTLLLVIVEIHGIRTERSGDTITENWVWIDKHLGNLQWIWRVLTAGFLVWVLLHFAGTWR
jgi:hypothetical protein